MEALLARLRVMLPDEAAGDPLLTELIHQAQALILGYTGRAAMPAALTEAWLRLAVMLYNRLGAEGESWRHEGGMTIRFSEFPPMLLAQLRAWRVGRTP